MSAADLLFDHRDLPVALSNSSGPPIHLSVRCHYARSLNCARSWRIPIAMYFGGCSASHF